MYRENFCYLLRLTVKSFFPWKLLCFPEKTFMYLENFIRFCIVPTQCERSEIWLRIRQDRHKSNIIANLAEQQAERLQFFLASKANRSQFISLKTKYSPFIMHKISNLCVCSILCLKLHFSYFKRKNLHFLRVKTWL